MKGRKKTKVYLRDRKREIERVAAQEEGRERAPRIPLVPYGLGAPNIAQRVDELLE